MTIHHVSKPDGPGSEIIPLELIQTMMDMLAEDHDMDSLKACSLVCHTFGDICRKHIFSSITIFSFNETNVLQFDNIVTARPTIKSYVRHLKYLVGVYDPHESGSEEAAEEEDAEALETDFESDDSSDAASWPTLTLALQLLKKQRVTSFELEFIEPLHPGSEEKQLWDTIPSFLVSALDSFIWTNPIVDLAMSFIQDLPAHYLSPDGWLRQSIVALSLTGITTRPIDRRSGQLRESDDPTAEDEIREIEDEDDISLPSTSSLGVPKLECFEAYWCELGALFKMIESHRESESQEGPQVMDFTEVKVLKISQDEPNAMEFIQYALRASQCLECLWLEGYDPTLKFLGLLANNLTAASLKTLTSMSLYPIVSAEHEDPYLNLADELEYLSRLGNNALEKLSINVRNQTNCPFNTEVARWSRLDEALLSQPGAFPKLKEVELTVILTFTSAPMPNDLRPRLDVIAILGFPRLRASARIEFRFRVEDQS